jgi:hypothetical protein
MLSQPHENRGPPAFITTPNTSSKELENENEKSMFSGHLVNDPGATCLQAEKKTQESNSISFLQVTKVILNIVLLFL